ncbi:MAG TPA: 50S ribosomal protein L23 [Anaerolineales bacterium]|uniref:Large ribosomal subunit protein uL23 n=1 Tax=uncultured Chloroflexi bacterium Rifle_16ft_4_minimus_6153 TaxID=1665079 RepID=A0A0H4TUM7_9CHLR|nr:50S ribosomal protein L23, large subunit ribosomal protein L23 [uncultured Chloroflexi bacterium Rifle_16ft_4_minimus_6153]HLE30614.1 50S ribosomal protein L23 [Anaerolineales bacterium]
MITVYDVLRRPIETEKSRHQSGKLHQYVFEVAPQATKPQIKEAVETLFDVEVQKINVIVAPAKKGRRGRGRRMVVRKAQYKKAIVTIRADQTIDVFEGVK